MGVRKLWPILEPTGQQAQLTDLKGYRVAIDFTYWIVEMSSVTNIHGEKLTGMKPHLRNLFWRCYHLLRNQVRPIFVLDGVSPSIKGKTIEQRKTMAGAKMPSPGRKNKWEWERVVECKELLDILGVPYITSAGEAEALCAKLDQDGLVDGCITDDSDAFLYGANTVYKNFTCSKQKTGIMQGFHGKVIEEQLGLNREKLIAMAMLLGSDYTDGVKNIGPETVIKLFGKNGVISSNVLERLKLWREDPDGKYAELERFQNLPKPTHCSKCNHQGSIMLHKAKGCVKCKTKKTCNENQRECDCDFHEKLQQISNNAVELRVRRWALEDPNFPSHEVIKEYLEPQCEPQAGVKKVEWTKPDFHKLQNYLVDVLKFGKLEARQKTNELLISWGLTHTKSKQQKNPLRCLRIVKARVLNTIPVLEVLWEDQGLGGMDVITVEDRVTMVKHFPRAVELFEEENEKPKKKLGRLNKCCRRIVDMFKSKKKLKFPSDDNKKDDPLGVIIDGPSTSAIKTVSASPPSSSVWAKSTQNVSASPESPPLISADCLIDGSAADFSDFLCTKDTDSSPEKVRGKETSQFSVLKRKSKKRRSTNTEKGRSPKRFKTSVDTRQPGVAELFKMKTETASESIPVSSPAIPSRSKSCSSDFTDGASTCSDLISDDDTDMVASGSLMSATSSTNVSSDTSASARVTANTVPPVLRRSPRESVRQKTLNCPNVTPSKANRKRLRFNEGDKQPKINDFMRSTKSSRLSAGIRL